MSTIPLSVLIAVVPGVVSAGGAPLQFNGLLLTESTRVPIGTVLSLPPSSVAGYFGASSGEAAFASYYGQGFDNAPKLPGALLFAQYPATAVAAWLRGGNISAMPIATLAALSGSLTLTVDGYAHVAASLSLSGATSFSAAAALIQAGISDPTECSFTGSVSGTVLTVTAVSSGTLSVGQTVTGTNVTAGSIITALGTGTGLTGTYTLSASSTASSESMTALATQPVVSYDSVSGGFLVTSGITGVASIAAFATGTLAASLLLTSATGATLSQGAAATTPAAFMNSIIAITQNWVSFTTAFDPDGGSGNTQKLAFSAWTNGTNNRYAYGGWDIDQGPVANGPDVSSFAYLAGPNGYNYAGTFPISEPSDLHLAASFLSYAACLDFDAENGRTTFMYRSQSGLSASCSTAQARANLLANGYNFYGAYGAANSTDLFWEPGSITGPFLWYDSFINQVWLNNGLQLAILALMKAIGTFPYNTAGYGLLANACAVPINAAVNFGAITAGVTLSAAQIAMVNNMAGKNIANTLQQRGWYLNIQPASESVRIARGSPPMTLFYVDGESIQYINLNSLAVQ